VRVRREDDHIGGGLTGVVTVRLGVSREVSLTPRSVADFYAEVMHRLAEIDMPVEIIPHPVEVPVAIPFADDEEHAAYDAEYAHRFWLSLVQVHRVFSAFRGRFVGKVSPVHFFWGAFDLAVTRFSGRHAPPRPGGSPTARTGSRWRPTTAR
jgi:hypothetical protein